HLHARLGVCQCARDLGHCHFRANRRQRASEAPFRTPETLGRGSRAGRRHKDLQRDCAGLPGCVCHVAGRVKVEARPVPTRLCDPWRHATAGAALGLGPALSRRGRLAEELGWRGFAWPLLQERMSPRTASICLGLLWAAWHLPREIPDVLSGIRFGQWGWGRVHFSQWAGGQAQFFLYCIALTVVIGYAVNRTGGSVLPAIMIHGGTNVWSKTNALTALDQYYMPKGIDFRMILLVAIAVFLLVRAGPELGRRPKTA